MQHLHLSLERLSSRSFKDPTARSAAIPASLSLSLRRENTTLRFRERLRDFRPAYVEDRRAFQVNVRVILCENTTI